MTVLVPMCLSSFLYSCNEKPILSLSQLFIDGTYVQYSCDLIYILP